MRLISFGNYQTGIKPLPFGSNLDQNLLNLESVSWLTCRPYSSYVVLKLSKIMAIKRFKKMNETTTMKLMKNG